MTRVLLVPDLPLERWPSMDRYAHRLHDWLESTDPGFEVRLAASIGDLTRDRGGRGGGRAHLGRPSPGVGPGRGSPEVRAARSVVRAAALRRPLLPVSLVAAAGGQARPARTHPRSQLRAHGDARAAPPRHRYGARPDAGHHSRLAPRRLARRR